MSDFNKDQFPTTKAEINALLGIETPASQSPEPAGEIKTDSSPSDTNSQQILLTGDLSRAFSDTDILEKSPCHIQRNILDAIETAVTTNFTAIAIVMPGTSAKLNPALKALRQANRNMKIILLAQTYEEPAAIKLTALGTGSRPLADDYLICPTDLNSLLESIEPAKQSAAVQTIQMAKTTTPAVADIKNMEKKIKLLEELATTDELTSLKNRRYIWEFFRQIIEHAKKENGQVTLLIFDIDDFKRYNDVYGHAAGDEVLCQAAILMQRSCREHDVVGRIGGDEFAVVFWDGPQPKAAEPQSERRSTSARHPTEAIFIARRFRTELNKAELHLLGDQGKGVLTISGGLASFPHDGVTVQQLFEQADKALLDAKQSGKNRIYLVGKAQSDIADI